MLKSLLTWLAFAAVQSALVAAPTAVSSDSAAASADIVQAEAHRQAASGHRRVVTATDQSGKSIVLFDTSPGVPVPNSGPTAQLFWSLMQVPASTSQQDLGSSRADAKLAPARGGAAFSEVDFPPSAGRGGAPQRAPAVNTPALMHRTRTVDFAIVMSGEIDMVLDGSTVHLQAGDVVIQQQANHGWVNRGTKVCRMAFVMLDARPP